MFHYAGHGQSGERLQSVLRLAQDTKLTTADILALPGVPRRVMLSACEGAATRDQDGGVTLADAFITAGAEAVVAAPVAVPDDQAQDFSVALYKNGFADPNIAPANAFFKTQAAFRQAGKPLPPFRMLLP